MGIFLPNEAWGIILGNLFAKDLLTTRLISVQLNQESLYCLKRRETQITIRSDIELVKYCKFLSNCSSIFHDYVNINFVLHPISSLVLNDMIRKLSRKIVRCTLNVQIQQPENSDLVLMEEKLTTILKHLNNLRCLEIIADWNTIMCKVDIPQVLQIEKLCLNINEGYSIIEQYFLFNSILEASPNIIILILKGPFTSIRILPPPLRKLKQLSVQISGNGLNWDILKYDSEILNNLLHNKPVLQVSDNNFNFLMKQNRFLHSFNSTLCNGGVCYFGRYAGWLVEFEIKMMVIFDFRKYGNLIKYLSEVDETLEVLKIFNGIRIFIPIEKKPIEIPPLKKLHTFVYCGDEESRAVIIRLKAENFPKLKRVTLNIGNNDANPFTEVYPTVKAVKFNYSLEYQNWQTTFPNLTSIKVNWCYGSCEKILDWSSKVQYLELCVGSNSLSLSSDKDIWNELTGNSEILPGTLFYIQKVHDDKNETLLSYPILPNVAVLKVKNARLVHVAAISFISHYHNFKTLKKLKFYIPENIFQTIPKDLIQILKQHHNVIFFSVDKDY